MTDPKSPLPPISLPPILRTFLLGTFALGVLCILTELVCRYALHLSTFPYGRPTLTSGDDYVDIKLFHLRFQHFHTPSFFSPSLEAHFLYPAPDAFFYRVLYLFPSYKNAFIAITLLIAVALWCWLANALIQRGIGIFAFFRERPWLAATLIGIAGACKGYPYLYLGLLFAKKQYRETAYSVALGFAINLFSLWYIADNFTLGKQGVAAGLDEFRNNYILQFNGVGLDHSLFGFLKRFTWPILSHHNVSQILTVYLGIAGLAALIVYFARVYKLPPLNQLLFLTVAAIILPPTSFDYTLLHLYTGWAMLVFVAVAAYRQNLPMPKGLTAALLCYILLLSPQNEIIFHGERLEGQIKCLALIALAVIAIRFPFPTESNLTPAQD